MTTRRTTRWWRLPACRWQSRRRPATPAATCLTAVVDKPISAMTPTMPAAAASTANTPKRAGPSAGADQNAADQFQRQSAGRSTGHHCPAAGNRIQPVGKPAQGLSTNDNSLDAWGTESTAPLGRRQMAIMVCGAVLFSLLAGLTARPATIPPVYQDEPWQATTGWKLATDGVFGSDMFAGHYNMDRRYYGFMPLHPAVLALVFASLDWDCFRHGWRRSSWDC